MICTLTRQEFLLVPVAQWIARWNSNPKGPGSNPGRDAEGFFCIRTKWTSARSLPPLLWMDILRYIFGLIQIWPRLILNNAIFQWRQYICVAYLSDMRLRDMFRKKMTYISFLSKYICSTLRIFWDNLRFSIQPNDKSTTRKRCWTSFSRYNSETYKIYSIFLSH